MDKTYIVIISVICGVISLLFFINIFLRSTQKKLEEYILNNFNKKEILSATTKANMLGLKSLGSRQIRGNGAIILTNKNLFSIRAKPFQEKVISIENINEISLPTSFNGKSVFKKLLCIHYQENGKEEAIAWAVSNPAKWKLAIENVLKNR